MIQKRGIFIAILIILFLVIGGLVYFLIFQKPVEKSPLVPEEKTLEEKIESITAPERETSFSQEEWQKEEQRIKKLLESITAPPK